MNEVKVNRSFIEEIRRTNLFHTKCNSFKVQKFPESLLNLLRQNLN